MAKERFVFPNREELARHRFVRRVGNPVIDGVLVVKCGCELDPWLCYPVTTNSRRYPNEPCKNCER